MRDIRLIYDDIKESSEYIESLMKEYQEWYWKERQEHFKIKIVEYPGSNIKYIRILKEDNSIFIKSYDMRIPNSECMKDSITMYYKKRNE